MLSASVSWFPAGILWQVANGDPGPPADSFSCVRPQENSPPGSPPSPRSPAIFRPAAVFNKRKCVACCTASCVIFLPEACFIVQIIFIIYACRVSALPVGTFSFFYFFLSQRQHFSGPYCWECHFRDELWGLRRPPSPFLSSDLASTPPTLRSHCDTTDAAF